MKPSSACCALLPVLLIPSPARVTHYEIDTAHSSVGFTIGFMGVSKVRGGFSDFNGTVMYVAAQPEASTVSLVIDAASINTNNGLRDKDLKAESFFNVAKFPVITFRSERIERRGTGFVVHGPLTIRDVTRDVAVSMHLLHPAMKDAWHNERIGFEGAVKIKRSDFGVIGPKFWNDRFDLTRLAVADSVQLEFTISAEVTNYDAWTFPAPPGKESIGQALLPTAESHGLDSALAQYRALKQSQSDAYVWGEPQLNLLGYKLLGHGKAREAAGVLKLNTELFPESANAHDSYAEALVATGDTAGAIANYGKAVQMNPRITDAVEMLRWLKSAPQPAPTALSRRRAGGRAR